MSLVRVEPRGPGSEANKLASHRLTTKVKSPSILGITCGTVT